MDATAIEVLSDLIETARKSEPGLMIDVKRERVSVFFWFDAATGRELVCAHGETFAEVYADAVQKRTDKLAKCIVEAEVRAEVEARMARAA